MAKSRVPSPRQTINVRRCQNHEIGRNRFDTGDVVTVELRIGQKVTGNPEHLLGDAGDA